MIVRAKSPIDARGEPVASSWAVTEGRLYAVLGLMAGENRPVLFRILDNEDNASLWRAEMFDLIDPTVPPSWAAVLWPSGAIGLGPAAWSEPNFLDRAYDDDPVAQRALESGKEEGRQRLEAFQARLSG